MNLSLWLTHGAAREKLVPCFLGLGNLFPSKLALVPGNSKAGLPRGWKYPALLCTRNTRPNFSPSVAVIIFVRAWAASGWCGFWGSGVQGKWVPSVTKKEGPQRLAQGKWWLCIPSPLPFHWWLKREHGEAFSLWQNLAFLNTRWAATLLAGVSSSFHQHVSWGA